MPAKSIKVTDVTDTPFSDVYARFTRARLVRGYPPLSYTRAYTVEMGAPVTSVTFVDVTGISAASPHPGHYCRSRIRNPDQKLQPSFVPVIDIHPRKQFRTCTQK